MTERRSRNRRTGLDRRQDERAKLVAEFRLLRAGTGVSEVLHGQIVDASSAGIRLSLDHPLQTSEGVIIEVRDGSQSCLNLTATVVWVESPPGEPHLTGCEIRGGMTRNQHAVLRRLLKQATARV